MSIETHLVTDDLPGQQIVLAITDAEPEPGDQVDYVAGIYMKDEFGYEIGVILDARDAVELVMAVSSRLIEAGYKGSAHFGPDA